MIMEENIRQLEGLLKHLSNNTEKIREDVMNILYLCDYFDVTQPEIFICSSSGGIKIEWNGEFYIDIFVNGNDYLGMEIMSNEDSHTNGNIDFIVNSVSAAFSIVRLFLKEVHDLL